jgi:hypothetical protein
MYVYEKLRTLLNDAKICYIFALNILTMKILNLSIKQKFFDEIVAGTKKTETREIRPANSGKYAYYESGGIRYDKFSDVPKEAINDGLRFELKKYDALKLFTGAYSDKRPYLIVEVIGEELFIEDDENGNAIMYEYEGNEYYAATVDYSLGKIIEVEQYR